MPPRKRAGVKKSARRSRVAKPRAKRAGRKSMRSSRSRVVTQNRTKHRWVIPKNVDRAHYILEDTLDGTLTYSNPAAGIQTAGFVIPANIVDQNLVPFNNPIATQLRYGIPSTSTATSPISVSAPTAFRQPGILTAFQRFARCVVTGSSIQLSVAMDSSNPGVTSLGTTEVYLAPLSNIQAGSMIVLDATRPSVIYPGTGLTSVPNLRLHNGVKSIQLANFAGSKTQGSLRMSMRHAKYLPLLYYGDTGFQCSGPPSGSPISTNPGFANQCGYLVQLHMPNLATSSTTPYTIRIRLRLYCTFFEPRNQYLLTSLPPLGEEKKEVAEDVDEEFSDDELELDAMPGRTPVGGPHPQPANPQDLPPKAMAPPGPVPGRAPAPPDLPTPGKVRRAVPVSTSQGHR